MAAASSTRFIFRPNENTSDISSIELSASGVCPELWGHITSFSGSPVLLISHEKPRRLGFNVGTSELSARADSPASASILLFKLSCTRGIQHEVFSCRVGSRLAYRISFGSEGICRSFKRNTLVRSCSSQQWQHHLNILILSFSWPFWLLVDYCIARCFIGRIKLMNWDQGNTQIALSLPLNILVQVSSR